MYDAALVIDSPGSASSTAIPVILTVTAGDQVTFTPPSLTFFYQGSSSTISPQTFSIQTSGASESVTLSSSSSLIGVTPTTGKTPFDTTVTIDTSGLQSTTQSFSITATFTDDQGNTTTQTYPVTTTEIQANVPVIFAVVNSALGVAGDLAAPGQGVTIYGDFSGVTTQGAQLTSSGTVATAVGGVTVWAGLGSKGNVAAPLTYVSSTQINAFLPYSIAGFGTFPLIVSTTPGGSSTEYRLKLKRSTPAASVTSPDFDLGVTSTNPAIFSASQGGNGQGAILNQDSSVNASTHPAAAGSIITIYATGEGLLSPQPATGSVTPSTGTSFPKPVAPVSVTIGGQTAQITYAGEAPGLISGVLQVDAKIPSSVGSGPQLIVLTVGAASNSQQAITVAVQ
jgi:trimeric autotransporter adhesin